MPSSHPHFLSNYKQREREKNKKRDDNDEIKEMYREIRKKKKREDEILEIRYSKNRWQPKMTKPHRRRRQMRPPSPPPPSSSSSSPYAFSLLLCNFSRPRLNRTIGRDHSIMDVQYTSGNSFYGRL